MLLHLKLTEERSGGGGRKKDHYPQRLRAGARSGLGARLQGSFLWPGSWRELWAKPAAQWVCHVFHYCISYQIVWFGVICGIWRDDRKKQQGLKENKGKARNGVSGLSSGAAKRLRLQKPRLNLKKYSLSFLKTSITQLGWFVNMVISVTFRIESRMSRWDLINSEILLICLPTRRKESVWLYKGISLFNLIKAGLGIQLGAHYETDMFDTSLPQTPRIKVMLPYHIELKYAVKMNSAVLNHHVPAKIHYLINILHRRKKS